MGDDGALAGMASGALFVDHTTASAEVARELYQQAKQKGIGFVDATVSGGQAGAVNGKLTVMCGGEQAHLNTNQPLDYNIAQAVTMLGEGQDGVQGKGGAEEGNQGSGR